MKAILTRNREARGLVFDLRNAETGEILHTEQGTPMKMRYLLKKRGDTLFIGGPLYSPEYGEHREAIYIPAGEEVLPAVHLDLMHVGDICVYLIGNDTHSISTWNGSSFVDKVHGKARGLGDEWVHFLEYEQFSYYRPRQNVIAARLASEQQQKAEV